MSDGFGNDFCSRGTASNFWRTSKARQEFVFRFKKKAIKSQVASSVTLDRLSRNPRAMYFTDKFLPLSLLTPSNLKTNKWKFKKLNCSSIRSAVSLFLLFNAVSHKLSKSSFFLTFFRKYRIPYWRCCWCPVPWISLAFNEIFCQVNPII